ncbi:MAG TPA: hypothetical protein VLL69_20475 [Streptosporangiaceae bacterium]|nr:hypothetical protein [Streptosporangiaceae bacterium]
MSAPAPPGPPRPEIAELTWIATELERLEESRRRLLARRALLLAELGRPRLPDVPVSSAGPPPSPPPSAAGAGGARRRREMSRRMVARLLLAAGGALIVIAAAVFTVANWASMGPSGRGAILLAVTALALAAPWPLARRDLAATAEAAAAIGLALTLADADLGWRLVSGAPGLGLGSASLACAALAAAWAAYGGRAPVRGPRLAATGLAQFPLPLAAAAIVPGAGPVALALAATAGGDLILAAWATRHGPGLAGQRRAGCLAAVVAWAAAVATAAGAAATAQAGQTPWAAAAFTLAGAAGIAGARVRWLPGELAGLITGSSGVLLAVGPALLVAPGLPAGWRVAAFAGCGAAVATAGWWAPPLARRAGRPARNVAGSVAAGGAAVLGAAGLAVLPGALSALWYPLAWAGIWAGPAVSTRAGRAPWAVWHGWPATPVVLAVAALACWLGPAMPPLTRGAAARSKVWPVAVALTALAAGSVPVVVGMPGWAALVTLTALAAAALATGSVLATRSVLAGGGVVGTDGAVAGTAAVTGLLVAVSAALWSLTGPAVTLVELAALTVICAVAAGLARPGLPRPGATRSGTALARLPAVVATAGAVATAAGLACAAALAGGLPVTRAAFAVAGVAAAAVGAAQPLRGSRPVHALVLELSAVPLVLLALAMASSQAGAASVLAALVALLTAAVACCWHGSRRATALAAAMAAAVVAAIPQLPVLVPAALTPFRHVARPWSGIPAAPAAMAAGLPLALTVLTACAVATVVAAWAWRGRRGSLDALAAALPLMAAPAAAGGLPYPATIGALLALTAGLAAWTAVSSSYVPAGAAVATASLTLAWALAAPPPTLAALGCLAAAGAMCAWRAPLAVVRAGAAAASVLGLCALAACAALAAGLPAWQAGLAALAAVAAAQSAAVRLARTHPEVSLAVEMAGWAAALVAAAPGLRAPGHASVVLTVTGTLCLCVALRPGRRFLLWPGLAQGQAALCAWLISAGVHAPEPYTVPAAAVLLAAGWRRSRRSPRLSSWTCYGPGLALLLLPSLVAVWLLPGWARPLMLGLAAAGITLAGARARLLAPLLLGGAAVVLDAGHELAPAVQQLAGMLPRWVPIAVIGLVLLAVGATYEARLRDLGRVRTALGRMR